ncbi:MAG TPA: hypothetical protein VN650_00885 [Gemmatimonadaceae bacterium]|nr:hypothetical protein [Gemmatimonadaceae bacterium]
MVAFFFIGTSPPRRDNPSHVVSIVVYHRYDPTVDKTDSTKPLLTLTV